MEFNFITVAFLLFSAITLGGAIAVVTTHNLFRATIWLMVSLFGGAGLFILLSAPFLAAIQVLVYIGAIAILFTFAVMLTRSVSSLKELYYRTWVNGIAAAGLFVLLAIGVIYPIWVANSSVHFPVSDVVRSTTDLGLVIASGAAREGIGSGFVLPFEVASLLLTAAMIGAIVIAREVDEDEA